MMMLLGWILFLLTLQIAIWRDVLRENLAETRAKEDLEFLRSKQAEWQAEKKAMQERMVRQHADNWNLATRLENVRRAANGYIK